MTWHVSHRPFVSGNYRREPDSPGLIPREQLTPVVGFEPMFGVPEPGILNSPAYARFHNGSSPDRSWLSHEDLSRDLLAQSWWYGGGEA